MLNILRKTECSIFLVTVAIFFLFIKNPHIKFGCKCSSSVRREEFVKEISRKGAITVTCLNSFTQSLTNDRYHHAEYFYPCQNLA